MTNENPVAPTGLTKPDRQEQFPRTSALPVQSPLFWVEQKDRYLRQLLIRDIEQQTKRRLVVYYATMQPNAHIQPRDIAYMAELLGDVGGDPVDLLLETPGGQTDATEGLISLIQATIKDLRVLVPGAAKSNGTLLALGAREIVMGPTSELGPIEPLVGGVPCTILATEEVRAGNFVLHMSGHYAMNQTRQMAQKLLKSGMMSDRDDHAISSTVHLLASRDAFHSHGSVVDHIAASALGLKVRYLEEQDDLWRRLWLLHQMFEYDCRRGGLLKIFEGRSRSTAIAIPPSVGQAAPLPSGAPAPP